MAVFVTELRHAVRRLERAPGFTLAAVATLALGLGANVAAFAVVDALLMRPLPVRDPGRLVAVYADRGLTRRHFSYPDYLDLRDGQAVFDGLAAVGDGTAWLGRTSPDRVALGIVSGSYFDVVGVAMAAGRPLATTDDRRGEAARVAVISHRFWRTEFAGDPAVAGKTIVLNGRSFDVIGVAAEGFDGLDPASPVGVWVPFAALRVIEPDWTFDARDEIWITLVGRLRAGLSRRAAEAALEPLAARIERAHARPPSDATALRLVPRSSATFDPAARRRAWPVAGLLEAVVAGVLLIACTNVAGLFLARASARRRELGVRAAIGATRARLLAGLATESGLLVAVGVAVGLVVARLALDVLLAVAPASVLPPGVEVTIDARVVGFALGAFGLTATVVGLPAALGASRADVVALLRAGGAIGRAPGGPAHLRRALIAAQVALSAVLLVGAGLFARTLASAAAVDPGFEADRVLLVSVDLGAAGYDAARMRAFYREAPARVTRIPGVEAAGLGQIVAMSGAGVARPVVREGVPWPPPGGEDPAVFVPYSVVGPGYFQAMGMRIRGRGFEAGDTVDRPPAVIVNEMLARRLWPGGDAIGRRVRLPLREAGPLVEVVGVAADGKYASLTEAPQPFFWLPLGQATRSRVTMHVRAPGDPMALAPAVRAALEELDPRLPLYHVRTLTSLVRASLATERFAARLLGLFGLVALVVVVMGVYGTLSFVVIRRTREIGVRLALGASSRDVGRMVRREAFWPLVAGLAAGMVLALWASGFVSAYLFGVTATDPATFAGVTLLLVAAGLAAGRLPARRATRMDPMAVLRE